MLQQLGSTLLKRQLVTWMLGQARPEPPVLIPFVRVGLVGLAAGIAGGLLFTLGFVGLLAALYLWVESMGLQPALALVIVSAVTFFSAAMIFFVVQRVFKKRLDALNKAVQDTPSPLQQVDDAVIELPKAIVTGFLQGILERDEASSRNRTN